LISSEACARTGDAPAPPGRAMQAIIAGLVPESNYPTSSHLSISFGELHGKLLYDPIRQDIGKRIDVFFHFMPYCGLG
jgi:hypothetical protein